MQKLAENSGISQSFISQIESGKRVPSPETLNKLADLLKVSKLFLYREAGMLGEGDILNLLEENSTLRQTLENVKEQLFSIRGLNWKHDNEITGLCIEIRQVLGTEDNTCLNNSSSTS